jgi:hypothetical protein
MSDALDEAPCQAEAGDKQHPERWPQHDKDDYHARQTHQRGFVVDGMPVAHGAEYRKCTYNFYIAHEHLR